MEGKIQWYSVVNWLVGYTDAHCFTDNTQASKWIRPIVFDPIESGFHA